MKNLLQNKNLRLILLILAVLIVILILFFSGGTQNTSDNLKIDFSKNISTDIKDYKINLPNKSFSSNAYLYTNTTGNLSIVQNAASVLNMQLSSTDSTSDVKVYYDASKNQMTLLPNANLLTINNLNNPKLIGFNKDNALILLENIFKNSFKDYYLVGTEQNNTGSVLSYGYKINDIPLIKDYSIQTVLTLYLLPDGTLTKLNWEYVDTSPSANVKLLSLDYIKSNISLLDKGVYPNPDTESTSEKIANYKDFTGTVEITDVELNYLIAAGDNIVKPVYKFSANFISADSSVKKGYIIVSAIDTSK